MNAPVRVRAPQGSEPVIRPLPGAGSDVSATLLPALERAAEWAGKGLVALVLSGSHASGEAVWAEIDGRRVSLSDLDLYAVMRDEASARRAARRADADRARTARDARSWGIGGALEVAFVTAAGLARMPARPGTVELSRSGRVVAGDPDVLERMPRWRPEAVSAEERLLLLENRAFELLWARALPADPWGTLRARHAVLKSMLDVAGVRTLAAREWPAGAGARVARAREQGAPASLPSWLAPAWGPLDGLWQEALHWRSGGARPLSPQLFAAEWHTAVRGWCAIWWEASGRADAPQSPWERALATAARAPFARRLRRSLGARVPGGLLRSPAGTPQHRVHGSAAVLLLAAAQSSGEPRLPAGALRALRRLGVTRAAGFDPAAADVVRAWDRGLHSGLRTQEDPCDPS